MKLQSRWCFLQVLCDGGISFYICDVSHQEEKLRDSDIKIYVWRVTIDGGTMQSVFSEHAASVFVWFVLSAAHAAVCLPFLFFFSCSECLCVCVWNHRHANSCDSVQLAGRRLRLG